MPPKTTNPETDTRPPPTNIASDVDAEVAELLREILEQGERVEFGPLPVGETPREDRQIDPTPHPERKRNRRRKPKPR